MAHWMAQPVPIPVLRAESRPASGDTALESAWSCCEAALSEYRVSALNCFVSSLAHLASVFFRGTEGREGEGEGGE
jgi:hypothetical protein